MRQDSKQTRDGLGAYRITEGVLARPAGATLVLFHPETERLLSLNECGSRIWQLLSEGEELARLLERLTAEFDAPEALIRQQVLEFLAQLEGENVICRE